MGLCIIITLLVIVVILSLLLFLQSREMKSISRQIRKIADSDTNSLIRTAGAGASSRKLIGEINQILKARRQEEVSLEKRRHAMDQMMVNISHDLRTPLTSAMGYIGMLQEGQADPEEQKREIDIIQRRLHRLEELLDSFFEFSRIITQGQQPKLEKVNLVGVLEESVANAYDDYVNMGREILLKCDSPRISICSNQNLLLRIFDNLISNAKKHGSGNLNIHVQQGENKVTLTFENHTDDPDLDPTQIFDEFYTTDISRTKGNTGLGLAIVKQFTEMLGGTIYAKMEGSLFRVVIGFTIQ